jgi:hypothetical protein
VPPLEGPLDTDSVNVLVLGESAKGSSHLLRRLQNWGCDCSFATSPEEALALVDHHTFRLILSTLPLHGLDPLLDQLGESDCTVFFTSPFEDGCWWVPLVRHGQKCLGTPALLPSEFAELLPHLLKEIAAEGSAISSPRV